MMVSVQRGGGGGRKMPSGALGIFSLRAEHPDVGLHLVVVRRDFFVGDGPVVAHAIGGAGPEIHRSEAESDASPVIGAAAHDAGAEPAELRSRRGGVGFAFDFPGAVGRDEFVIQFMPVLAADADAAMRQLVGPDVLFEILFRIQRRARFQHHHVQAAFGEHFRGRAACRARSNDADVIHFRANERLVPSGSPGPITLLTARSAPSTDIRNSS